MSPAGKLFVPLNAMCSRKCASPLSDSVSCAEPLLIRSLIETLFGGSEFFITAIFIEFGSVFTSKAGSAANRGAPNTFAEANAIINMPNFFIFW